MCCDMLLIIVQCKQWHFIRHSGFQQPPTRTSVLCKLSFYIVDNKQKIPTHCTYLWENLQSKMYQYLYHSQLANNLLTKPALARTGSYKKQKLIAGRAESNQNSVKQKLLRCYQVFLKGAVKTLFRFFFKRIVEQLFSNYSVDYEFCY